MFGSAYRLIEENDEAVTGANGYGWKGS